MQTNQLKSIVNALPGALGATRQRSPNGLNIGTLGGLETRTASPLLRLTNLSQTQQAKNKNRSD
jgi:hypothetical protein